MSDDPNARHLANLDDMRVAMDATVLRWAQEDVATAVDRAAVRASFEAGLAHFAEKTGTPVDDALADVAWPDDNMDALQKRVVDLNEKAAAAAAQREADAQAALDEKVAASMPPAEPVSDPAPAFVPPEPVYTGTESVADSGTVKTGGGAIHF